MDTKQTLTPVAPVKPRAGVRRPPGITLLKPERIQEYLKTMPGWRLLPGDAAIGRVREFPEEGAAAAYAAFVTELVGRDGHPFVLERFGRRVTVTLYGVQPQGIRRGGLTSAHLDTARALG